MFELVLKRRAFIGTLTMGALATGAIPHRAVGAPPPDEHEIDLKNVPAHVKSAANKAAPHVKWKTAFKSEQNGEVMFELEGIDQKKRDVTVILNGEGKVEEIETEIPVEEVPATVMAALKAKVPTLEVAAVTEILEGKKIVAYDFAGTRPSSNKSIGVYVSADGKTVEIDDN
jgi:hypothetical protein